MIAAAAPFVSYSANNEDVILNRLFGAQSEGFFVDIGAAHPLYGNNTRALYDRGWHGINIEPTKEFYRELVTQRLRDHNLNIAVSDETGNLVLHEVIGTGLSTGDAADAARAAAKGFDVICHTVLARTLRDILEEAVAPAIDVLIVDVGELELKVMQSNDWDRFRPRVIMTESALPKSSMPRQGGVDDYLTAQGYHLVYFGERSNFYIERDFAAPAEAFDRPPNVFDCFVPFAQQELVWARATLATQLENLQQEQDSAGRYIASLREELARCCTVAETQGIDLNHARAELISMRGRSESLAIELSDATMRMLLAQRDAQDRLARAADADQLVRQLDAVYASKSWKLTWPLRALARRSLGVS